MGKQIGSHIPLVNIIEPAGEGQTPAGKYLNEANQKQSALQVAEVVRHKQRYEQGIGQVDD